MFRKTTTIVFALATLAACSTPGRDYSTISVGEQADHASCTARKFSEATILENKTGTIGGVIDGVLSAPERAAQATKKAARSCAREMNIDPDTVPGFRP